MCFKCVPSIVWQMLVFHLQYQYQVNFIYISFSKKGINLKKLSKYSYKQQNTWYIITKFLKVVI